MAKPKEEPNKVETVSANDGQRVFASPLAKKIASDKGIDLATVNGSGDNGRIVKRDVENYQPSAQANTAQSGVSAESKVSAASVAPINLPVGQESTCLLYTSPSPRDLSTSRMPSSA